MSLRIQDIEKGIKSVINIYEDDISEKWEIVEKKDGYAHEFIKIEGTLYPILPWRSSRLVALKNKGKQIGPLVDAKFAAYEPCDKTIEEVFFREFDLTEFLMSDTVKKVFALKNGRTINAILTLSNGALNTLELSAVMPSGSAAQGRRKILGKKGWVTDQPIHTKIEPEFVYLYNDGVIPTTYSDGCLETYGLSVEELTVVTGAYFLLTNKTDREQRINDYKRLCAVVDKILQSFDGGQVEVEL